MTSSTITPTETPTLKQQAGKILTQVAGYVGVRTMEIGLRSGLFAALADAAGGATAQELADQLALDPTYVNVWARAGYGAELLELVVAADSEGWDPQARAFTDLSAQRFALAPHVAELLLDESSPAFLGGMPLVLTAPEMFDTFRDSLASGERLWWDRCSPQFLEGVSGTGGPFYTRLVDGGALERVPGVAEILAGPARVIELCAGAGRGLVRLLDRYPQATALGIDGDAASLELARARVDAAGHGERVTLQVSPLEEIDVDGGYDLVVINISMHECRDIARVTDNVKRALRPGGVFVISDFPFPATTADCRTVPARIMGGIQFFEALIDDQLMPTAAFVDVLERRGFERVGAFDLTPVHAVTYGRKPIA